MSKQVELISKKLNSIKMYGLEAEVITSALEHMQSNNKITPAEAFELGCKEWDIFDTPLVEIVSVSSDKDSGRSDYLIKVNGKVFKIIDHDDRIILFPNTSDSEDIINQFKEVRSKMKWR